MTKEEIQHLAQLARIELSDPETETLNQEIDSILSYVGVINSLAVEGQAPTPGPVSNVWREDVVVEKSADEVETLLEAMPERDGRYLKVKKILNQEDN